VSKASEQQHLMSFRKYGPVESFDTYKAAIAVANNGAFFPSEETLSVEEQNLLNVRRNIFKNELQEAEKILLSTKSESPLLKADQEFLLAQIFHKKGNQKKASELMYLAADLYHIANEEYRELRARTNAAICLATLESCLTGELLAYEQESRRQGFMEIAANICRTRAIELLIAGRQTEAHLQAKEAANLYLLDGYTDDRAVAIILAAIALFMNGEKEEAQLMRNQCLVTEGKVANYIGVYEALLQGKTPQLYPGHPLAVISWQKNALKSESVPGKIVQALKEKPRSRDELISLIWGANALDISYNARLHTAINYIKKSKGIHILHDGEKYKLP
jgi:hypothetical protein